MYLDKQEIGGHLQYSIRETYHDQGKLKTRTLFDLGTDPSRYIVYPGGNSHYIHERIELSIVENGYEVDTFELETLFWPFLEQRFKMILRNPSKSIKKGHRLYKRAELLELQSKIHIFDKRRLHFLRFGIINQKEIETFPYRFFNRLLEKSRGEIECMIDEAEKGLRTSQLKDYVYTIFDLQRYFDLPGAITEPHTLDQDLLDDYFLRELCLLNADRSFFTNENSHKKKKLHDYLIKYLIMYFDNDFPRRQRFDYFNSRYRFYQQPKKHEKTLSLSEACRILNLQESEYHQLTKRQLIRRFRKLAHKCHPDKGGSNNEFICLCEAYKRLLEGKEG